MYLMTFVYNKHSGNFPVYQVYHLSKDQFVKCNYKYISGEENMYII